MPNSLNAARRAGHQVLAVGTTVVRALETVTDDSGATFPGEGWTDLVITADRPLRSVTGLISGLHEPRATHLSLIERVLTVAASDRTANGEVSASVTGRGHLERAYGEARRLGYLWHEFGDSHLIVARRSPAFCLLPSALPSLEAATGDCQVNVWLVETMPSDAVIVTEEMPAVVAAIVGDQARRGVDRERAGKPVAL